MSTTIKLKRDTANNWTTNNPTLAIGEPGVEVDTFRFKIGDGVRDWHTLPYISYVLPTASQSTLGGVRVDGTTIKINNGIISTTPYTLPAASTTVLGGVRVDGITITVNNGVITAVGGGGGGGGSGSVNNGVAGSLTWYPVTGTVVDDLTYVTWANSTLTVLGTVAATTLTGSLNASNLTGTVPSSTLPLATNIAVGGVKVDGSTITISNGVISATQPPIYSLPIASPTVLGGVKVDGTTITVSNGVISSASAYILPAASMSTLGGVKVDGSSITITNETISATPYVLPTSSTTVLGGVKVDGTTITIANGVITAVAGGGQNLTGSINSGNSGNIAFYPSTGTTIDDLSTVAWNSITNTLSVTGNLVATTLSGTLNASNLTGSIASGLLPTATTSALGGVKVDGTTIMISNGVISSMPPTDITGNAGSVTNGVYVTGSYSNPTWITSLSGTKVTNAVLTTNIYNNPSWLASIDGSKVTGGVVTSGSYSDPTWITSLSGTKVTNAVLTTNIYNNPSWLASIDGSKVTGGVVTSGSYSDPTWITSLSGAKVTNAVLTTGVYSDPIWITSLSSNKLSGIISSAVLPTASQSTLGGVKIDGTTIGISNGIISVILSTSNPIGYGTGAGSSATVSGTGTSQTVTINKSCGTITCATESGSNTIKTVTVTNSNVVATDTIVLSGQGGTNPYVSYVYAVGAGSFKFDYYSPTGNTSEAPKFNFALIKAVSA